MLKTLALFILLKVAEVAAVVFLPWAVGHMFCRPAQEAWWSKWFIGFTLLALAFGIGFLVLLVLPKVLPLWISANWEWAEGLAR